MSSSIITDTGRIFMARHLLGLETKGITHVALGDGDDSFVDPANPPDPSPAQTALRHERVRKRFYKTAFLESDPEGLITVEGMSFSETEQETRTLGIFFRFETDEANGIAIREYGFFGGDVTAVGGADSETLAGGVYDPVSNPEGQVLQPGSLYEVKNIPDFRKFPDTEFEIVGIFHL